MSSLDLSTPRSEFLSEALPHLPWHALIWAVLSSSMTSFCTNLFRNQSARERAGRYSFRDTSTSYDIRDRLFDKYVGRRVIYLLHDNHFYFYKDVVNT